MATYLLRARWRTSIAIMFWKETTQATFFLAGMRIRSWREIILNRPEWLWPPAQLPGNVYDIHIVRNYFTVNGAAGYRSEVELGYGFGFIIEGNYEEGPKGAGTECAVNAVPGPTAAPAKVMLRNAFSRVSEGEISAHEFCYKGSPNIPPGRAGRVADGRRCFGGWQLSTRRVLQLSGPLELGQGAVASTDSSIKPNDVCSTRRDAADLATRQPAGAALLLQRLSLAGGCSAAS